LKRAIAALFLVTIVAVAWALYSGHIRVPNRWNPWAALEIAEPPNLLTRYKLGRLSKSSAQCQAVLQTTDITYEPIPDEITGAACGYFNAVRIGRTSATVDEPFALTCRAAVSLALWERHVLQPTAQQYFGVPVVKIEHFGSYSCRNVYGRPNATRSRHATAEAFDVAGFVLEGGERIRIVNDWNGEHGAFLRTVRDGACRFFDGVLSPDYNAAHRDHFHLDRGPYRVCR
jgi:hypothetical protein